MPEELKQCPFCGGDAVVHSKFVAPYIICNGCGARSGAKSTEWDAMKSWNRRLPMTPPIAQMRDADMKEN